MGFDMSGDELTLTTEQLETIKAMTRVEAVLEVVRDELKEHEVKDDKHFDDIFKAIREIPKTITVCRDDLKNEIHDYNSNHFVSKQEFNQQNTKFAIIIGSITTSAVILSWVLATVTSLEKIMGG